MRFLTAGKLLASGVIGSNFWNRLVGNLPGGFVAKTEPNYAIPTVLRSVRVGR